MIQTQRNTATIRSILFHLTLFVGGGLLILPVLWMVSASFMTRSDVLSVPVHLLPPVWQPQNYVQIFVDFNIGLFFINSVVVTGSVVILNLLFCSLPIGLAKFLEAYQNEWHLLMAGAVVAALPLVLLFLVMQRRFLEGMAGLSGLKG